MTGTLAHLGWALVAFVAGHFVLSAGPVRRPLVGRLGEGPFRGAYSVLSIAALAWVVLAYQAAPAVEVWQPHMAFRHIGMTVMPFACVFLVAAYTVPNPSALVVFGTAHETPGIIKVTRHPAMWGVGLWGIVHVLANTDAPTMMLGGGMALLAIGGAWHIELRRADDPDWRALKAETSFVPFAGVVTGRVRVTPGQVGWARIAAGLALYGGLLWGHEGLFGVSPLPLPGS